MQPAALFLCNLTDTMPKPWADAGVLCYCVDLQHPKGARRDGNIVRVGMDIHRCLPPLQNYVFAAAFPSCTDVAVSGARWLRDKGLYALSDAVGLFARCVALCEWTGAPYMIENPVSTISTYWRKPDFTFHPNEYGGYEGGQSDTYTKKTCLWTGGGFVMPEKRALPVTDSRIWLMPPSDDRANLRSATPAGFARATFEANYKLRIAA